MTEQIIDIPIEKRLKRIALELAEINQEIVETRTMGNRVLAIETKRGLIDNISIAFDKTVEAMTNIKWIKH